MILITDFVISESHSSLKILVISIVGMLEFNMFGIPYVRYDQ